MRYVLVEPLAWVAAALVLATASLVAFSFLSDLPERNPLFGVFVFSLIPLLAVAGIGVFFLVIRSESIRRG